MSSSSGQTENPRVAVVIPCYRVLGQVREVLQAIGPAVWRIYCIDDACPEGSGSAAREVAGRDPRIQVITHEENRGVGGAVVTGYRRAVEDGADVIVKIDGDGQMNPADVGRLAGPILAGEADYVKGNRFFQLEGLRSMPWLRLVGNAGLSFLSKLSTGYWNLFDPTNGFTAIHADVVRALPLKKLHRRYFFESDLLFRLNTLRAVVVEVPMKARYEGEQSSLSPVNAMFVFPFLHARNLLKRLFYNYYLRNFSVASVNLLLGVALVCFGTVFGAARWASGVRLHELASAGTVMLAALPVVLGVELLLSFLNYDIAAVPRDPIQGKLQLIDDSREG